VGIRLLIVEPDEEVLESHLAFFQRTTDFELESAGDSKDCIEKLIVFVPHVLLLEPALPSGLIILDQAEMPVVVLSRLSNDLQLRSHPSVSEYYVKPKPLAEIGQRILELATSTT
jgi:hypothetical protein